MTPPELSDGALVAAKVTPAATYVAAHATGAWSIGEWAAGAALIYSVLMILDFAARRLVPLYRRWVGRP